MILFIHDTSDALMTFCRGYADLSFKNKKLVDVFYVIGFTGWIYTRLYVFPRCFIIPHLISFGNIQEKYK